MGEFLLIQGSLMQVLNHICGLIDETLRDLVVFSICRASLVCLHPQVLICCGLFHSGSNFVCVLDSGRLCLGVT